MKLVRAVSIEPVGRGSSLSGHIALGPEIKRTGTERLQNIMLGEAK
jgi:hypothetical protein